MPPGELAAQAERWRGRRATEKTVFRSEIEPLPDDQHRVRHGVGATPSAVALDLPFMRVLRDPPAQLGPFDVAAVRNRSKVAKAQRAFERLGQMADVLRGRSR
jgi:hypothetical protein